MNDIIKKILSGEETNIVKIVNVLREAADAYYNDNEIINDSIFDAIEKTLRIIDPNNPYFSKVGSDVRGGKIPLPYKMGSLDQVYKGDVEKWIKDNNWGNELFVIGDKADGASEMLIYGKNGEFQIGYSRGNGIEGSDISRHIKNMILPLKIQSPMAIRVEVIISEKNFSNIVENSIKNNTRIYKNARNYVSGKMNSEKAEQDFYDNVKIIATSLVEPEMGKIDQYELLTKMGFEVPSYIIKKGYELNDEFLTSYLNDRRKHSSIAIDGIVIDLDNNDIRTTLWRKSSSLNPMYSRKYKIPAEDNYFIATVIDVEWNISKSGYLKPRVVFEPFDLGGITIQHATGFNYKFIKENGIGIGSKVSIIRSGDVIPYITGIITKVEPLLPNEDDYDELILSENEVDILIKDINSPKVQYERLIAIINGLSIVGLKEGNIAKLYESGFTTIESIIKANEKDMCKVLGNSAGSKSYLGIKDILNPINFAKLAGASQTLGRGIGVRKMSKVIEKLGNNISDYTYNNLLNVEGFEDKSAKLVIKNLPTFLKFLNDIEGYYTVEQPKIIENNDFNNINVCFTGVRNIELEGKIISKGGKISSGVNSKLSHLVCKDPTSNSSKMIMAKKLGIMVISLEDGIKLWN